jgi:hypothetical protein
MNNAELKQRQYAANAEQEQLVGYWIRRFGISKRDLDTHPHGDDLVAVLRVRQYLKPNNRFLTKKQAAQLGVIWQRVYTKKGKLYPKHYKLLESIVLETDLKATQQQLKITEARLKIQQARA